MGPKDWITWLTDEAISNYVVFIAGIVVAAVAGLVRHLLVRKRPSIIRVEKKYEARLVNIDDEVKEKLKVTYEGRPIEELYQAIFTVNNRGDEPIKDIDITFHLKGFDQNDFLSPALTDSETAWLLSICRMGPDLRSTFHLSFLNPRKSHKDYLALTLYARKPLEVTGVTGKGFGWSTEYFDRVKYFDRIARVIIKATSPFGYGIARAASILGSILPDDL